MDKSKPPPECERTVVEPFDVGLHVSGKPFGPRFATAACFKSTGSKPSCIDICNALLACGAADWTLHAPGPGNMHSKVLTHSDVSRDDVRAAIYCHPPVATEVRRLLVAGMGGMTAGECARCSAPHRELVDVVETDRFAVATAVVKFFCDSKNGKMKLLKNRLLSVKNTMMWKQRVHGAAKSENELERKASVALQLKEDRWEEDMVTIHGRLEAEALARINGRRVDVTVPTVVTTGVGTAHLTVIRRDPTVGHAGRRISTYPAPAGMIWLAAETGVGVAHSVGKITVCTLPWRTNVAIPAASSVQLGADALPNIAGAAIGKGCIFYSYNNTICQSHFGARYEGAASLSRTVLALPGTSTVVMLHGGHTAFFVNSEFGAAWPQAQLAGARRVSVVTWNAETPISSEQMAGRALGRYNRPAGAPPGPFKIYDSLPMGLIAGTPIPAVKCGSTMVACQLGTVVYRLQVPFVGIGSVPSEWVREKWGVVEGKLLAACVTPDDRIRIATTVGVYDDGNVLIKLDACTSAAWIGHETLVRDDVVVTVAMPNNDATAPSPKRLRIVAGL